MKPWNAMMGYAAMSLLANESPCDCGSCYVKPMVRSVQSDRPSVFLTRTLSSTKEERAEKRRKRKESQKSRRRNRR